MTKKKINSFLKLVNFELKELTTAATTTTTARGPTTGDEQNNNNFAVLFQ